MAVVDRIPDRSGVQSLTRATSPSEMLSGWFLGLLVVLTLAYGFTIVLAQDRAPREWVVFAGLLLLTGLSLGGNRLARGERLHRAVYLESLIEESPLATVLLDPHHKIVACNPSFEKLFLHRRDAIVGADLDELITAEEDTAAAEGFTRQVLDGEAICTVARRRRADGKMVDVRIFGIPLVSDDRLIGVYALYEDMTAQLMAEQAHKMEAVGRLAAGIAHDFNNLLTITLGRSSMLRQYFLMGSDERRYLDEIHQASERASALTQRLLAFSRKRPPQVLALDVNGVLESMKSMLVPLIREDIELRFELDPGLAAVRADRGGVEQVILNLALNAQDAMSGGGELTLRTRTVELEARLAAYGFELGPGPYVVIEVEDTGSGMDGATLETVFEPFFTTKDEGQGTGLGLAIVYSIVQQAGGAVTVKSAPGQGTVFRVHLPRWGGEVETALPPPTARARGGSETVLVVEDVQEVGRLVVEYLALQGYRVIYADHPRRGLELVEEDHERQIDLLLTDIVMPEMDGFELARRVVELRPGIRVLYMTGYAEGAGFRQPAGKAGACGPRLIRKPFTADELAQKVREALGEEKPV